MTTLKQRINELDAQIAVVRHWLVVTSHCHEEWEQEHSRLLELINDRTYLYYWFVRDGDQPLEHYVAGDQDEDVCPRCDTMGGEYTPILDECANC